MPRQIREICGALIICSLCLFAGCGLNAPPINDPFIRNNIPPLNQLAYRPYVNITQVWSDNNVMEGNRKGIRLRVRAIFARLDNLESLVAVYFFDEWGWPLQDLNGLYRASDGQVSFALVVKISQPGLTTLDASLFMPYDELHVQPGARVLCRVRIYDRGWRIAGDQTGFYSFTVPWF
jgi:hypothetical protein